MFPICRVLYSFQPLVPKIALADKRLSHPESVFAWEATVNFSVWLYHDLEWSHLYTPCKPPIRQDLVHSLPRFLPPGLLSHTNGIKSDSDYFPFSYVLQAKSA